jgi:hypothetical protein
LSNSVDNNTNTAEQSLQQKSEAITVAGNNVPRTNIAKSSNDKFANNTTDKKVNVTTEETTTIIEDTETPASVEVETEEIAEDRQENDDIVSQDSSVDEHTGFFGAIVKFFKSIIEFFRGLFN